MFLYARSRNELRRANSQRTRDSCEWYIYMYILYRTQNNKIGINEVILVNWTLFGDNISTVSVTGTFSVVVASVLTVAPILRRWQRSILLCAARKQAANFTWRPSTNWRRISSVHPWDSSTGATKDAPPPHIKRNVECAASSVDLFTKPESMSEWYIYKR